MIRQLLARIFAYIALVPGRRVTIGLINGEIVTGRVRSVWVGSQIVWLRFKHKYADLDLGTMQPYTSAVIRSRHDEGVSWCRGWRGRDVDALLAGWALR